MLLDRTVQLLLLSTLAVWTQAVPAPSHLSGKLPAAPGAQSTTPTSDAVKTQPSPKGAGSGGAASSGTPPTNSAELPLQDKIADLPVELKNMIRDQLPHKTRLEAGAGNPKAAEALWPAADQACHKCLQGHVAALSNNLRYTGWDVCAPGCSEAYKERGGPPMFVPPLSGEESARANFDQIIRSGCAWMLLQLKPPASKVLEAYKALVGTTKRMKEYGFADELTLGYLTDARFNVLQGVKPNAPLKIPGGTYVGNIVLDTFFVKPELRHVVSFEASAIPKVVGTLLTVRKKWPRDLPGDPKQAAFPPSVELFADLGKTLDAALKNNPNAVYDYELYIFLRNLVGGNDAVMAVATDEEILAFCKTAFANRLFEYLIGFAGMQSTPKVLEAVFESQMALLREKPVEFWEVQNVIVVASVWCTPANWAVFYRLMTAWLAERAGDARFAEKKHEIQKMKALLDENAKKFNNTLPTQSATT